VDGAWQAGLVLVVSRFSVPEVDGDGFAERARLAIAVLSERPGFGWGRLGRAADDPTAWVLVTEWEHVGAWRRALSSYEVRLEASPLLGLAADEPSAFEVLEAADALGQHSGSSDRADGAELT